MALMQSVPVGPGQPTQPRMFRGICLALSDALEDFGFTCPFYFTNVQN